MPDVVQIAKERRERLASELAKLDEFIQMAQSLMKWHESKGNGQADATRAGTGVSPAPMPLHSSARAGDA